MPLESLSDEQFNIHDLTLEQEKKPESESKKLFHELMNTPLYNKENKLWNYSMSENQDNIDEGYFSRDQLLDVLTQVLFDKKSAKEQYAYLKTKPFYTSENQQWQDEMVDSPDSNKIHYRTSAQLLDVLCQNIWDKKAAEEKFQTLKEKQFDPVKRQWTEGMDPKSIPSYNTELQLISFLTEAELGHNPDQIKIDYEKLKNDLYDEKYDYLDAGPAKTELFLTESQLLDVLVRSKFDRQSALSRYEQLKNSKLFDPSINQWNVYDSEAGLSTDKNTGCQLLGILCEHEFEEETLDLQISFPALPETRSY